MRGHSAFGPALLALLVAGMSAPGCTGGSCRVVSLDVEQKTALSNPVAPGCLFALDIWSRDGTLLAHERLPCIEEADGYWFVEKDSLGHSRLSLSVAGIGQERPVARFRLGLEGAGDTGIDSGTGGAGTVEHTGQVRINAPVTVTMDGGAVFSLAWFESCLDGL